MSMEHPRRADPRTEKIRGIVEGVALSMGVDYSHVVSTRAQRARCYQEPRSILARHVAMWLVRQTLRASLHEVARFFHVDHSTVHSACRRIDAAKLPVEAAASIDSVLFGDNPRWARA